MKKQLFIITVFCCNLAIAQIPENSGYFFAKEYSKEISLYKAKEFVIDEILKESTDVVLFQIDPLAATTSGEITSLVYKCKTKNVEGLILGFYGNYWNKSGVVYQGYAFKNLPKNTAIQLLEKITNIMSEQSEYLGNDPDNNNVYFQFDDLTILIYKTSSESKMRIFWKEFDAEWTLLAFSKTKRRFEKSFK